MYYNFLIQYLFYWYSGVLKIFILWDFQNSLKNCIVHYFEQYGIYPVLGVEYYIDICIEYMLVGQYLLSSVDRKNVQNIVCRIHMRV